MIYRSLDSDGLVEGRVYWVYSFRRVGRYRLEIMSPITTRMILKRNKGCNTLYAKGKSRKLTYY